MHTLTNPLTHKCTHTHTCPLSCVIWSPLTGTFSCVFVTPTLRHVKWHFLVLRNVLELLELALFSTDLCRGRSV
uniref:Uncharacterized protein n=1 Tax=Anguilla anguilla TaxID=7936 RepID=A0A0E9Q143_ANGAN